VVAAGPEVHLPNPPHGDPARSSGRSQLDAEQQGIRDVATGAVDPESVAAGVGPLGFDLQRDSEGRVESLAALQGAAEATATGHALIARAAQGHGSASPSSAAGLSRVEVGAQLVDARAVSAATAKTHQDSEDVLEGKVTRADGARYPGAPIAPGTQRFASALFRARLIELLPFVLPLLIESVVVYTNMREYLRTDDLDVATPASIAGSTVALITLMPFLIGRGLSRLTHGAPLAAWTRYAMIVGAVFWPAAAVLLAVIRVSIDQANAVAEAEDQARSQFQADAAPVAPVDPAAVFDPTVPIIFWIVVFCGLGVMVVLWELLMYNPARIKELQDRRARVEAASRVVELTALEARIDADVALAERALEDSLEMWRLELDAIPARVARDKQVYRTALRNASGDPRMTLALELRDESPSEAEAGR
jgi:hypothetical protein